MNNNTCADVRLALHWQQKAGGDSGGALVVPGAQAFLLYDSFGFPLELTAEIAAERGASVDVAGFEAAMEAQRRRSKDAAKVTSDDADQCVIYEPRLRYQTWRLF